MLTVEKRIREVDEYQISSREVRLDIRCFGTKERVKEIKTKLDHCLLHWVQALGVDLVPELWFSSATRKRPDHRLRLASVVECIHAHVTDDQKRGMHVQGHRLARCERLCLRVKKPITSILSHPMIASILSAVRSCSERYSGSTRTCGRVAYARRLRVTLLGLVIRGSEENRSRSGKKLTSTAL